MNILNRTSNNINIANFWENYHLKKYNFSPDYQREGNVWSEADKVFLIDTIMKNFPMPPIFLHQHINPDTGITVYDVIDGKQRLLAIIEFLENKISISDDFATDGFGSPELEGIYFDDLSKAELTEWKKNFWKYEITIEYVETAKKEVVNNIFDRLNRNGEALTSQELRKAKHGNDYFYTIIVELSESPQFQSFIQHLKSNRLEHHEFISELIFLISEDKVLAGDRPAEIDELYIKHSKKDKNSLDALKDKFLKIACVFEKFELNFDDRRFYGTSHIYGLWGLAWKIAGHGDDGRNVVAKLQEFYEKYKSKDSESPLIESYRITMSAGTKGASRRQKRIDALYQFVTS